MTPTQRALARHALGLPNEMRRSYRNYWLASILEDAEWAEMAAQGDAIQDGSYYRLTRAGAMAAKNANERLDPEDFPI